MRHTALLLFVTFLLSTTVSAGSNTVEVTPENEGEKTVDVHNSSAAQITVQATNMPKPGKEETSGKTTYTWSVTGNLSISGSSSEQAVTIKPTNTTVSQYAGTATCKVVQYFKDKDGKESDSTNSASCNIIINICEAKITYVSIPNKKITISLLPIECSGDLTVYLINENGTDKQYSGKVTISGTPEQQYGLLLGVDRIPKNAYNGFKITWVVNDATIQGTTDYHFRALGDYRNSQYNIPSEEKCSGNNVDAYVTTATCDYDNGELKSQFYTQVNINGSGHSINYNTVAVEAYCLKSQFNPPDDANRKTFRKNHTPYGACNSNKGELSNSTVAIIRTHPYLKCGDRIYISGIDKTKTVTDYGGGLAVEQLDNFTTENACSGIADIGNSCVFIVPE